MSLGSDKAKIALEQNGELKYLKDVSRDPISYTLTTESDAEEFTVEQVMVNIKALRDAEPEEKFIIIA